MFASRFITAFLAMTALAAYASPAPVEVQKRADVSNVQDIIATLQASTSSILPQLNTLAANNQANQASVTPLAAQLVSAFNTASTSLNGLGPVDTTSGGSSQDVANSFAPILIELAITLKAVLLVFPSLPLVLLTVGLDLAIQEVLLGLDIILIGVVKLIAGLLFDVSVILKGLGFVLVLLTLSL